MTPGMIEALRSEYAKINTIDPCGPSYRKLVTLLDALPQPNLQQLAAANIKFVSSLARNRVKTA